VVGEVVGSGAVVGAGDVVGSRVVVGSGAGLGAGAGIEAYAYAVGFSLDLGVDAFRLTSEMDVLHGSTPYVMLGIRLGLM